MSFRLPTHFLTLFRQRINAASKEDVLIYGFLCPAFFLYVVFNRFPFLYLAPYLYSGWRLWKDVQEKTIPNNPTRNPVLAPVFLVCLGGFLSLPAHELGFLWKPMWRDILIIGGYFLPFAFAHRFTDKHIKALFLTQVAAYVLWVDYKNLHLFLDSFFSPRSLTEYDMGLFFGLFFIYFIWKKDYLYIFFNAIILLLVSKRAIYLGLVPALVWMSFQSFIPWLSQIKIRFRLLLIGFLTLGIFSFAAVDVLTWFLHTLIGGNQRIDFLLNGRAYSLNFITFKITQSPYWNFVFGHGPGQLDVQLSLFRPVHWAKFYPEPTNPHNDFLKLFYDYGLFGFLAFAWYLCRIYSVHALATALLFFTMVLFFFDNSLIHSYYNLIALAIVYTKPENIHEGEVH